MARRKTEAINLRMSSELKALLRAAADREHRTLSNMIEHLLIDYCERNNITQATPPTDGSRAVERDSDSD